MSSIKRGTALSWFFPAVFCIIAVVTSHTFALDNGVGLTPPMGWYPWNVFGESQNETLIKEHADILVTKGFKDAGYLYVGPDEGRTFYRDNNGVLQPNTSRWPSGMKGLGDYIHGKGLKFMLYTDIGTAT